MAPVNKIVRCKIKNLDTKDEVEAYFNPKELSIDQQNTWNQHSKGDKPVLEFTDAQPKTLSLELLFDTYESRLDVHSEFVKKLEGFAAVMDDSHPDKQRPPMCVFVWGSKFPQFMGVISSLSTKYTMFFSDGTPCRATCTIKMTYGENLRVKQEHGHGSTDSYAGRDGQVVQQGDEMRADRHGDDHRQVLSNNDSDDGRLKPGQPVSKRPPRKPAPKPAPKLGRRPARK